MNILVTDGENRSALAATRSLGKKGYQVFVTANHSKSLASSSRYCYSGLSTPDPLSDGKAYVKAICDISCAKNIDMIFPMTEQTIYLLNPARHDLPSNLILACPSVDKIRLITDKAELFVMAEKLGVSIPKTTYIKSLDDFNSKLDSIDYYPVVVKPALSKIKEGQGFLSTTVLYANSRNELEQFYKNNRVLKYPSMIQEKIIGSGTGLFTLYDKDEHLALFSHRRIREKPPSGGVSVISESIVLEEEMVDAANRLLSAVAWQGVAMVEFKHDQKDNKPKLMEINGRLWGSLQLAISCGVDFPNLLVEYYKGNLVTPAILDYKIGHRLKWFFGTLDHLLICLKSSQDDLSFSGQPLSKKQSIQDFLKVWERNLSFDVLNMKDIKPFLTESYTYLMNVIRSNS